MNVRRFAATTLLIVVACASCGSDSGGPTTQAKIPNQPAGLDGKEFCAQFSGDFVAAAVDEPYRTYDAQLVNDLPVPGVVGYECQWEWVNPEGDQRNVKVDVLDYEGALEGSLDASWKEAIELVGPIATPVDNLGDDAVSAKLQGSVTLSTRQGQRQVTIVGLGKGSASPPTLETMALIAAEGLEIGK